LIKVAAVVGAVTIGWGAWWYHDLAHDRLIAPPWRIGETASRPSSTTHRRSASTISTEERIDVTRRGLAHFLHSLIAIEDQRFYSHGAIDPPRVAAAPGQPDGAAPRAPAPHTAAGPVSFLTAEDLLTQAQEVIPASRIEPVLKPQILELYVNRVHFGNGPAGIEAASRLFREAPTTLTLAEAAMLAGLVQSPSAYAPTSDATRAMRRRATVLNALLDTHAITKAEYAAASKEPLKLNDALSRRQAKGAYFFEEIRKSLVDKYGSEMVYEGGRVYSTIDQKMQAAAEVAVASALKELDARGPKRAANAEPLQAALIAIDPRTGYVRALVGGRSFAESHFDRAMQANRQPGSAFKPFVYASALESGYTEATVITDLDKPLTTLQGALLPDDGHIEGTSIGVRDALRLSSNARHPGDDRIGVDRAVRLARRSASIPAVSSPRWRGK
jgi:penicillin-binding protein 1A